MHDPFSMRPFFGYNFGHYLQHWISLGSRKNLPTVFMVNWFRKSSEGSFLWPGFGENIRVLDWCLKRCDKVKGNAEKSPIGLLPSKDSLDLTGLQETVDLEAIFSTPKDFWLSEIEELRHYFHNQVGNSLPQEIIHQLDALEERFNNQ